MTLIKYSKINNLPLFNCPPPKKEYVTSALKYYLKMAERYWLSSRSDVIWAVDLLHLTGSNGVLMKAPLWIQAWIW